MVVRVESDPKDWKRLDNVMQAFPSGVQGRISAFALKKAALIGKRRARRLRPYSSRTKKGDERHLKDTIEVKAKGGKFGGFKIPGLLVVLKAGSKGARHAHIVELGSVKWRGKPFMRPAIEATEQQMLSAFAKEYNKRIEGVVNILNSGNVPRAWVRAFRLTR